MYLSKATLRNALVSYMDILEENSLASSLRVANTDALDISYMSRTYVHTWVTALLIVCTYKRCSFESSFRALSILGRVARSRALSNIIIHISRV